MILINSISITCKCSVHNVTVIIVDVQGIASINNSLQYLIKNISIEIASNHECIINDLTGKIDQLFTITITKITINFYETSPFLHYIHYNCNVFDPKTLEHNVTLQCII